VKEPKTTDIFI